ncbi:LysR family transcriptional regulator [Pseudidiomarina woesei]|uniref:DNA-binding transcriptional regulator, LysR family n=1 Tax=Pseudidiomarina woesei TaxID=1381080 RepID=A0A0K6HAK6_9GAMM|nr:LysR family transcriptional regulator [Pseudidiomarina woesei]CUA87790.1 DNA-binding transcriptional regulator, LysR family [Pseudidiomarina woesei]
MQHLPLEALRAFISIYELQSYTAAAQQLNRSQPAISLQLQRLEELLGVSLLSRSGGRIHLTPAGSELLEQARQLLGLNDQIIARFTEPSVSGQVRLGIPSEFASKILPQVLGQFAQAYPNVSLSVTSALSKDLLKDEQAHFDLVIALKEPDKKSMRPGMVILKQEPLVWVGAQHDIQHGQEPLPLVVAPEGCIYRRRALTALRQANIPVRISFTNADFSGLTAAIESGLGLTVLAQSTVPDNLARLQRNGTTALPELGEVNVAMWQADADNQAARQLAQFIQERI